MRSSDERGRYSVTSSLIGWVHKWSLNNESYEYHIREAFHVCGENDIVVNSYNTVIMSKPNNPDSKVHKVNMGPIWGRQDPGGPHVGPMNFAICVEIHVVFTSKTPCTFICFYKTMVRDENDMLIVQQMWKKYDCSFNISNLQDDPNYLLYVRSI